MSANRVQKLLFSEYCDFDDMVLVESPFAQTTKDGIGLRQVHIGLTPSKLILAADILPSVQSGNTSYNCIVDPEIETFELIAIYPVECVTLTIYRRRKRQALKARFCNSRVLYFELGGFEKRSMFWNLWCEKVKFLCPGESDYSRSETSVGTSTTESSLCLVNKKTVLVNGIKQLWCRFGPNLGINTSYINNVLLHNSQNLASNWRDKYLFMGKDYQESPLSYKPIVKLPSKESPKKQRSSQTKRKSGRHPSLMEEKRLSYGDNVQVNRFGSGINEGCETGLYLTVDKYIVPKRYDETQPERSSSLTSSVSSSKYMDYDRLAESALLVWEYSSFKRRPTVKHRRRYGFAPRPLVLFGLGLQDISQKQTLSLQARRTCSEACLTATYIKLGIPKRQLLTTISCPDLRDVMDCRNNNYIKTIKNPIYFWTSGYWYRPTSAKDIYFNLQTFFKKFRYSRVSRSKRKILCLGRKCNNRKSAKVRKTDKQTDDDEESCHFFYKKSTKYSFIVNMLASRVDDAKRLDDNSRQPEETPLQHMRRMLTCDPTISAWDFDSSTLAEQLTIIDRDLFLKIPSIELQTIFQQLHLGNAPNMAALVAFSSRLSCLLATEVLRNHTEKIRARLIARFINVANKCHRMSNFQSSRSVLSALQSPAIFRLRKTWAYIRKKHSSKYQTFEFLCRLYRDPRPVSYQKSLFTFSQCPPCIPYIGHLVSTVLNEKAYHKVPNNDSSKAFKSSRIARIQSSAAIDLKQTIFSRIVDTFLKPTSSMGPAGDHGTAFSKSRKSVIKRSPQCIDDKLREVIELMEKCQVASMNYNLRLHAISHDFLLKARYLEDKENFYNSLKIE
ncbi:hypothetical protein GWI33_013681 [Rhynchophorus ferrugineus]|uniref:Ras-GEF domain-containing protein n=1 Tax=Rhynchophorus ferrugineus TaxID=354439 RepID=A0A834I918_RHYFE|nr:hypothetical protein GWI33_013681 [Rhynchophorus ferrugineus]